MMGRKQTLFVQKFWRLSILKCYNGDRIVLYTVTFFGGIMTWARVCYLLNKPTSTNGVCYVPIIPTFELETGRAIISWYWWCPLYLHYNIWLDALQVSSFMNHKCKQLFPLPNQSYWNIIVQNKHLFSYKMIKYQYFHAFVKIKLSLRSILWWSLCSLIIYQPLIKII